MQDRRLHSYQTCDRRALIFGTFQETKNKRNKKLRRSIYIIQSFETL